MKHWFLLAATTAALTTFAPAASQAQIGVEVPGVGVRIGEPPRYRDHDRDGDRHRGFEERDVRGGSDCRTKSVTERGPDGSSRTVTRRSCD